MSSWSVREDGVARRSAYKRVTASGDVIINCLANQISWGAGGRGRGESESTVAPKCEMLWSCNLHQIKAEIELLTETWPRDERI